MKLSIVMTLGPASTEPAVVERLLATADRFRLNASHLMPAALREWLAALAAIFARVGREVPVVVDLRGAKMRIAELPEVEVLPPAVRLVRRSTPSSSAAIIHVPHAELFEQVRPGEELTLNDGKVRLSVDAVTGDEICAQVTQNGPLASFKGINRASHPILMHKLNAADRAAIEAADERPFVEYALSFVLSGNDASMLRAVTERHVIAKIERPEAMAELGFIDERFDELWLCRGDLAEQAGLARLGELQRAFTRQMQSFTHPSFLAGQVLEHMTHHEQPTRSEVVHLYDIEQAGWQGIVLSDETAVGDNPVAVAELLDAL